MRLTKEKINYLLFLYNHQNQNYTVTKMAQHLGISKSTLSRVLNHFYQEDLILEKENYRLLAVNKRDNIKKKFKNLQIG